MEKTSCNDTLEEKQQKCLVDFYKRIGRSHDLISSNPLQRLTDQIILLNMKSLLPPPGSRILDAGGGTGKWAILFAKLGYHVTLVDLSSDMLSVAERRAKGSAIGSLKLIRSDITDMECFEDECFDFILSAGDPVSYCGNPDKAMGEFKRVLCSKKYLVISVDNLFAMARKLILEGKIGMIEELIHTHMVKIPTEKPSFYSICFSPEGLVSLLKKNGFEVVKLMGVPVFFSKKPNTTELDILSDDNGFELAVKNELDFCDEPSLIGHGGHLVVIGRKS